MPTFQPTPDLTMHYEVDDFTDPWREPETVLLLHGNAESGAAWYGWVPHLARHYRVVRPDMRGFGASTPMPRDFPWTFDRLIEDFTSLMDRLDSRRFHLVGAKIGGTIARAFAARRPERVKTLTVVGTPPPMREGAAERAPELADEFETKGVEHWARRTMAGRLGSDFPPEGVEWWIKFMSRTAVSTQIGFMKTIACADIRADVPRIALPDARHHDRWQRARVSRPDAGLAAADPAFGFTGAARQLLPRSGQPLRTLRRGDTGFHSEERRHRLMQPRLHLLA